MADKRNGSPAFQFYPKDFLTSAKVMAMSLTEAGAYIKLLSICWLDGSLPPDTKGLARMLGITANHMSRLWPALAPCFAARDDGRLINKRLEVEREKQAVYRQKQKHAAASRWDMPKASQIDAEPMPQPMPEAMPEPSQSDALLLQSPISNLQSKRSKAAPQAAPRARTETPKDDTNPSVTLLRKLAYEVIDDNPGEFAEQKEALKERCARLGLTYDATVIGDALETAQRLRLLESTRQKVGG